MRRNVALVAVLSALMAFPVVFGDRAVAAPKDPNAEKVGKACHIVSGGNAGKSGTYTIEADGLNCTTADGDQSACKDSDGKDNGKCKDGAKFTGNPHDLLRDILVGQASLFKDQTQIVTRLKNLADVVGNLVNTISDGFNACTPPDLVPLPIPGLTGPRSFCRLDVSTNLHVVVTNQGGVNAGDSMTRVVFNNVSGVGDPTTPVDIPTDPVAGFGGSRDVAAPIPSTCFDDNRVCKFKISVDFPTDPSKPTGAVFESSETNNTVDGECGGDFIF